MIALGVIAPSACAFERHGNPAATIAHAPVLCEIRVVVALHEAAQRRADDVASAASTDAVRITHRGTITEQMQLFEIAGKEVAADCEAAIERLRAHTSVRWVERDERRERHLRANGGVATEE
jgi:uncharacterized Zn-binding protein involved in type VI secretion